MAGVPPYCAIASVRSPPCFIRASCHYPGQRARGFAAALAALALLLSGTLAARGRAALCLDQSVHRSAADDAGGSSANSRAQSLCARSGALLGCGQGQPISAAVRRGRGRAGAEAGRRRRRPLHQARHAGAAQGEGPARGRIRPGALAGRCQEATSPDGRPGRASRPCRGGNRAARRRDGARAQRRVGQIVPRAGGVAARLGVGRRKA